VSVLRYGYSARRRRDEGRVNVFELLEGRAQEEIVAREIGSHGMHDAGLAQALGQIEEEEAEEEEERLRALRAAAELRAQIARDAEARHGLVSRRVIASELSRAWRVWLLAAALGGQIADQVLAQELPIEQRLRVARAQAEQQQELRAPVMCYPGGRVVFSLGEEGGRGTRRGVVPVAEPPIVGLLAAAGLPVVARTLYLGRYGRGARSDESKWVEWEVRSRLLELGCASDR
jgi:hypothetical protein